MRRLIYALTLVLAVGIGSPLNAAQTTRSFASGKFALFLEGTFVGYVDKVSGGFAVGNVVHELPPVDYYVHKHLESPHEFKEISLTFGLGMDRTFYQWIQDTLEGAASRKDGEIIALDSQYKPLRKLEFANAQITEITLPRADGRSRSPVSLTIQLTPDQAYVSAATGTKVDMKQKQPVAVLESNFVLTINGLDMRRTYAVEMMVVQIPLGPSRPVVCIVCPSPLAIDFPDVTVTLNEVDSQSMFDWYNESIFGTPTEKKGSLEFRSSTGQTVLGLSLHNLGVISVENIARPELPTGVVALRMYAEFMKLEF